MSHYFQYAQPRQTIATGSVQVDTIFSVSSSIFRVTGGPIAIWSLYGYITADFPTGNVQWKLTFLPKDLGPGGVPVNFCVQTSTFGVRLFTGSKYFLDDEIGNPMHGSNVAEIRGNAQFSRYVAPGTIYHVNENSNGATPAQMQYHVLWSPLTSASNVEGL